MFRGGFIFSHYIVCLGVSPDSSDKQRCLYMSLYFLKYKQCSYSALLPSSYYWEAPAAIQTWPSPSSLLACGYWQRHTWFWCGDTQHITVHLWWGTDHLLEAGGSPMCPTNQHCHVCEERPEQLHQTSAEHYGKYMPVLETGAPSYMTLTTEGC